jgi:hypothetical protein
MKLSSPSFGIFLVSVVLVIVVLLSQYTHLNIPLLTSIVRGKAYEVVLLAWILLFVGVAFNV